MQMKFRKQDQKTRMWQVSQGKDGTPAWPGFAHLRAKEEVARLNPQTRGSDYAGSNPQSDDSDLTGVERGMLDRIASHIKDLGAFFRGAVENIKYTINSTPPAHDLDAQLRELNRGFEHDTDQLALAFGSEAWELSEGPHGDGAAALQRQLRIFRAEQGIGNREATYPGSAWLQAGIFAVLIFAEGLANAYFYREVTSFGYLGGLLAGMGISALIVGLSAIAGFFFLRPALNCRPRLPSGERDHRKLWGWILFLLLSYATLVCLFAAAHFREAAMHTTEFGFTRFYNNPLGLEDMESVFLLGIGLGIIVLSIWKGYRLDDPHPGYGQLSRALAGKLKGLTAVKEKFRRSIGERFRATVEQAENAARQVHERRRQLNLMQSDIEAALNCADFHRQRAIDLGVEIISAFREGAQTALHDKSRYPVAPAVAQWQKMPVTLDTQQHKDAVWALFRDTLESLEQQIQRYETERSDWEARLRRRCDEFATEAHMQRLVDESAYQPCRSRNTEPGGEIVAQAPGGSA